MPLPLSKMAAGLEAAGELGAAVANAIPTHRQCTIEIENKCKSHTLLNPRMYIFSGSCSKPLSPAIGSDESGDAIFIKTPDTATGAVGVFTYDLLSTENKCTKKIAVMYSVPYDFNLYSNWYAVGIYEDHKKCDYDLYYEMYYDAEDHFVRHKAKDPGICYSANNVTLRATMSDSYEPFIKVHVSD